MKAHTVHLGFEVGSADPVEIPIRHMAVTGQTQESGKTTALTALIARAKLPAIAFLTKRGEGEMPGRKILPYFQERADWRFVQSILESTMREKMKFERAWIVRACQGAHSLLDVQLKLIELERSARNALSKDVYMLLGEYLERVVPLLATLPKADKVEVGEGLAVMDLVRYPLELQMLVISSTLTWIHQHANGVISIIPEAWKFIPQGRNTPVRIAAENLMREGAALKNYVCVDSQDMAGVDKILLRGCPVWLIGVQREPNEIKRALASMPAGLKKPKAEDVATLELGQFYACFGKSILKTYVQPAWMSATTATLIAQGELPISEVAQPHTHNPMQPAQAGTVAGESPLGSRAIALDSPILRTSAIEEELVMQLNQEAVTALKLAIKDGAKETALQLLDAIAGGSKAALAGAILGAEKRLDSKSLSPVAMAPSANGNEPSVLSDALYSQILDRLLQDLPEHPRVLQLLTSRQEIVVKVQKKTVELDDTTLRGRLAILISENFFDETANAYSAWKELFTRGIGSAKPNVYRELDNLTAMGFLTKGAEGYKTVSGMKVTKNRIENAA
jgi:hypothetical protein